MKNFNQIKTITAIFVMLFDKCKALCVLPFTDYLKLRHVSKKDHVVMQGEVRGYTSEYDLIVVKQCKIISVNGVKQPIA